MRAEVPVLAPVAAEGAVDTRQAPAKMKIVRDKETGTDGEGKGAR